MQGVVTEKKALRQIINFYEETNYSIYLIFSPVYLDPLLKFS